MDDYDNYINQKPYIDYQNGIYIYPSEYFCPTWCVFGEKAFTPNTVAIHWNQSSWFADDANHKLVPVRSFKYRNKFKRFLYANSPVFAKILLVGLPDCWLKKVLTKKIKIM